MNVLEFSFAPHGAEDLSGNEAVHILIDGRDLIDILREIEGPQASADGQPDIAGTYDGLFPEQWRDLPEQYGDGRVAVLGCVCGEVGCWPFRVRIAKRANEVTWGDFQQPNRSWSYESLGSFSFDRVRYDRAVQSVLDRAADA